MEENIMGSYEKKEVTPDDPMLQRVVIFIKPPSPKPAKEQKSDTQAEQEEKNSKQD
jgi:hypothetical protein